MFSNLLHVIKEEQDTSNVLKNSIRTLNIDICTKGYAILIARHLSLKIYNFVSIFTRLINS